MSDLPTPHDCLAHAFGLLDPMGNDETPAERAEWARVATAWVGLASVQLQLQNLEWSERAEARADEQLKIQRRALGPLNEIAKLTEQIAACEHGRWTAGDVNDWIQQAVRIQAALQ